MKTLKPYLEFVLTVVLTAGLVAGMYYLGDELESDGLLTIVPFLIIAGAVYKFVTKLKDQQNKKARANAPAQALKFNTDDPGIKLKPDKVAYVLRNSYLSIVLFGFAIFIDSVAQGFISVYTFICVGVGFYLLIHNVLVCDKIRYHIDHVGIEIRDVSFSFRPKITVIPYNSIRELIARQALYEAPMDVGTLLLDTGEKDDDGDVSYQRIIGIPNHEAIARIIEAQAAHEAASQLKD